jgi:protein-disulfide isomerase
MVRMSSRSARREEARAAREAAERAEAAKATRARRLRALGVVAAIAVALVIAGIVVSQSSEDPSTGPRDEATGLVGVAETRAQFDGLTQDGTTLGSPDAELVLTEFADLQCPFCAQFAMQQLPGIVDRYVRSGDVRLELRTRAFLGEDSVLAARAAQAAGTRDRMWQFVDLFYRNQGEENSGYATGDFLASVARGVGLPAELVVDGARSRALDAGIRRADREAQAAGLSSTPAFLLGEEAGEGRAVEPDQVEAALSEAVRGT